MENHRYGNFSSSEIFKLIKTGKGSNEFSAPGLTYIEEKKYELRLGKSLTKEHSARPTTWGTFVESFVFEKLDMSYKLESLERLRHKTIDHWTGAPDVNTDKLVGDIKCPYSLKSFCQAVDSMVDLETFKAAKPEYYWQLVSNAILTGKDEAESIVYCPYQEELLKIREATEQFDGDQNKVAWIYYANDEDLPCLIKGKHYKDLNKFSFVVPEEDKNLLTERVKMAIELLDRK